MKPVIVLAALIMFTASATLAHAEHHAMDAAKSQMQETLQRLELTDEQMAAVKPVLESSAAAREEIMANYGMDAESRETSGERPGRRQLRAMKKELDAVQDKTMQDLEQILTDEQLAEFKLIQQERQSAMRERMRSR